MQSPREIVLLLWAAWLISWLVAAVWSARTVARAPAAGRLLHSAFVSGGTVLIFAQPALLASIEKPLYPQIGWVGWAGAALTLAGLGYSWWARIHLGRLWSGTVTLKEDHSIVQTGPYRLTRHPIYTGLLLALTATTILRDTGAAFLGFALLLVGLVLKLRQEERLLAEHFGHAYREYQTRVPALVPGIW